MIPMSLTETLKPILKEIDGLRNKQAKLEKALAEVDAAIDAKNTLVRAIVNGEIPAAEEIVDEEASA
jgi:DNA-binding protein YbaB